MDTEITNKENVEIVFEERRVVLRPEHAHDLMLKMRKMMEDKTCDSAGTVADDIAVSNGGKTCWRCDRDAAHYLWLNVIERRISLCRDCTGDFLEMLEYLESERPDLFLGDAL